MKEKSKTGAAFASSILSLGQSYLLAYSMPGLGATTSSPQDYIKGAEPMGQEEQVENTIFPQDIVLHLGKGKHTMLYPGTNFYNLIYGKLKAGSSKAFSVIRFQSWIGMKSGIMIWDWSFDLDRANLRSC